MGFEAILKVIAEIAAANGLSYGIVGALAVAAFVLMYAMLPVKGLAYVFAPALFWGGLVGIYTAREIGLVFSTDTAVNTAATAAIGIVTALGIMVVIARFVDAALRIRKPLTTASPVPLDRRMQI